MMKQPNADIMQYVKERFALLRDPEKGPDARMSVDQELYDVWQTHDKKLYAFLVAALHDGHRFVRETAARGLGVLGDKRAVAPLVACMQQDPDIQVRMAAAVALGTQQNRTAYHALRTALHLDLPNAVKSNVVRALGRYPTAETVAVLERFLWEESPGDYRFAALEGMCTIDLPKSTELLIKLIEALSVKPNLATDNRAKNLLSRAVPCIGQRRDPRIFPLLISVLAKARLGAIIGLGYLHDPRAIPYLQPFLSDPDIEIRQSSALSLADLGDRSGIDCLLEILRDRSNINTLPYLFKEAALAVAHLHEASAVPLLTQALEALDLEYFDDDDEIERLVSTVQKAIVSLGEC